MDGAFSSVAGTVSDRLGGPLSGVQVTLVSDASGEMHSATTAPDATFEIEGIPPFYTKYLTIWRRMSDGQWRFVADLGNSRPAPAP